MKAKFFIFIFGISLFSAGCGSSSQPNSNNAMNGTGVNSNGHANVDSNNLPPGLSTSPIPPSANTTPGIPPPGQAINAAPKGATPTPGIPDPKEINKPMKPGATPTPGIPDTETIRRQMAQPNGNVNKPPPPTSGDSMMKKKPLPVNKPN